MTLLESFLLTTLALVSGVGVGYVLHWVKNRNTILHPTGLEHLMLRRLARAGGQRERGLREVDQLFDDGKTREALTVVMDSIRAHMLIERIVHEGHNTDLTDDDLWVANSIMEYWIASARFSPLSHGIRLMRMMPDRTPEGGWNCWTPPNYVDELARQQEVEHSH